MLSIEDSKSVGLDPQRWQSVLDLLDGWCKNDRIPAAGLIVGRSGKTTGVHLFGRQRLDDSDVALRDAAIRDDAIFLIASITKPIVATGILLLIERGLLTLGDRVCDVIPEFQQNGKAGVRIRHLLTHTSGLPDMLPDNRELRIANAPLSEFVAQTCSLKLDFPPGRAVQYQSMGFAVLGEVIHRLTGKSCPQFLQEEIFTPLQMHDTTLCAPDDWFSGEQPTANRIAELRVPEDQRDATDWGWNSRYWRSLGAPWGGLLTTPADLARFAHMMLRQGSAENVQIVGRATLQSATRNQLEMMRDVPKDDRRCRPWGLGWRLNWPAHSANFGDFLGPRTYGHWGATGTVLWIDPDLDAFAILLTTQPQEPHGFYLARISNAIAAAFV